MGIVGESWTHPLSSDYSRTPEPRRICNAEERSTRGFLSLRCLVPLSLRGVFGRIAGALSQQEHCRERDNDRQRYEARQMTHGMSLDHLGICACLAFSPFVASLNARQVRSSRANDSEDHRECKRNLAINLGSGGLATRTPPAF